jgi:hypothetical protein
MLKDLEDQIFKNPNDAELHWRYGCVLGYLGRWQEAWPELEWRLKGHRSTINRRSHYPMPTWKGEQGKVLVYQDQGFGDFIMWVRYTDLMSNVVLEVAPELFHLMKNQGYDVIVRGDALPNCNFVIPVSSLPAHFKTIINEQYINIPNNDQGRIGVAWTGFAGHADDSIRSSSAEDFSLLVKDGRKLTSLMVTQSDLRFEDYSLMLADLNDTAKLIAECHTVVSVDTAVAHLAAAMGKTVHLALAYQHDWRWGSGDSIWYPTMKIWRQKELGNWKEVLSRISDFIG